MFEVFHSPPESPFQIYLHSLPLLQPVATLYSASPEKLGNDSTPLIQAVRAERFSPAFLHQLSSRIKYMSPGAASDAVGAYLNLAEQTLSADRSFLWLDALGAALSAAPSSLAERHGHLLSNLQASSYPDKHRLPVGEGHGQSGVGVHYVRHRHVLKRCFGTTETASELGEYGRPRKGSAPYVPP